MKKLLLVSLGAVAVLAGGYLALGAWRKHVVAKTEERAFTRATRDLAEGRPLEALAVADDEVRTDGRFAWDALKLNALVAARHIPRLMALYERSPERLLAHEEGSLLVARALDAAHRRDAFTRLRTAWRGREQHPELWLALDSDLLGRAGKVREAEQLLRSKKFTGEAEVPRLVRLALHAARRNLFESWTLLDQAYALAPRNPEVRSFRAQILESIGKSAEARVEYVAAHLADPKNPLLRDELAEFYRRQGNYDLALQTWRDALANPMPDFIALKAAFWGRVIQPAAIPVPAGAGRRPGTLGPLVDFVEALPAARFWDAEGFARLPEGARFAQERQEVFWLQLLELLRTGKEREAADLLRGNRFRARSWRPELEVGLSVILNHRTHQSVVVPPAGAGAGAATNTHSFLVQLQRLAATASQTAAKPAPLDPELARVLDRREVFAGAFLAAGWREAALGLGAGGRFEGVPVWFDYGYAQCLRFNRGNPAALDYLGSAPRPPEIAVLRGELLLAAKRPADGRRELEAIARDDSDAGYRAAWLAAGQAIEAGDLPRARDTVRRQPRLANSVTGRELLARLALLGGAVGEAEQQYQALAGESVEAQAFLARQAFARHDWPVARRHTEALLRRMPDEMQLRENLAAISRAEKGHENR